MTGTAPERHVEFEGWQYFDSAEVGRQLRPQKKEAAL